MKILKNIKIYVLLVLVTFTIGACDLTETNVDPASLTEDQLQLNLVLPSAEAHMAFNSGALGARNPGIVMQYFLGLEAQQQQYSQYLFPRNAMDNMWRAGMYGGGMKDLMFIIEATSGEEGLNAPHYSGIAKIYMAESLGMLTTMFGDIPYSEAFQGADGNISPAYDTQDEIFASIQTLLDEAISELSEDVAGTIAPAGDDVVFGGDADRWIATAYSLKARYLLTEGNFPAASAALANGIKSNAGSAVYPFEASVVGGNPLFSFGDFERPGTMAAHPTFVAKMASDPRRPLNLPGGSFVGGFWTSQASPLPLITYAEVKFMEAEIAAQGGADVTATVRDAIRANMEYMGVPEEGINLYLLGISNPNLATVMDEKYKAVYPNSRVAWSDYRRTGFPALSVPSNASTDFYSGPVNDVPARFIYPESEFLYNRQNLEAASERQGFTAGGQEALDISLSVFQ